MSDWQDPFADDQAARARAERRAARERRRRGEETRESLGERVRSELEGTPAPAPPPQVPTHARPEPPPAPPTAVQQPPTPPGPVLRQPAASPPPGPPRPPSRPPSDAIQRRRMMALVGLGVLIVLIAVIGTVLSRGDEEAPEEDLTGQKVTEIVIPEGNDRTQIADIAKKEGLKGDYLEATASTDGFDAAKYGAEDAGDLEGFLFPATYEVFKGANVDELIGKQLEAFAMNASELNLEAAADDLGLTPYEVVIVASMVEREIAVPEERELAASVIYNRLEAGNPLGIDATIRFEDQNYTDQILESRLAEDTPYNTRTNAGLPPGPIGNPGLASLEAAAKPAETDYFYFVVKPGTCNEHVFVETEAEFMAAEAEYQAALQAEGGSPTEC